MEVGSKNRRTSDKKKKPEERRDDVEGKVSKSLQMDGNLEVRKEGKGINEV